MQLTTCHADLDHALRTIAPAIGVRSSHPILDCALLTATAGSLAVTGFNLDLGISVTFPAAVAEPGSVALPYRLLAGLVSRMEADEAISIHDGVLTASGGSYGLAALDAVNYPAMPAIKADTQELHLSTGIRACMLAVSTDASKQVLTGIHLAAGHMEATDGHRLMRVPITLPDGIDLVLPAPTLKLLADRVCTIAASAGQAVIDAGDGITIYSRILDGAYPNVTALIPASFTSTMELDRHKLTRALERVAIIAEAHNSVVKLTAAAGGLEITAEADANNGRELLAYSGTATGVWAFNVRYLLDGLKAMRPAETITLSANTATTPVVLRPTGDDALTYLVMPIQVRA